MFRLLPSHFIKALTVAFFCCLGASGKDKEKQSLEPQPLLALKEVHPKTDVLASKVEEGIEIIPPGYKIYQVPKLNSEGKKIGQQPILLSIRNIVSQSEVQTARPFSGKSDSIFIRLTKEGGQRVTNATKKMNLGVDRIAIVIEGKCQIAPIVQAVLAQDFMVNGLDDSKEVTRLVKALNAKDLQ